MFNLSRRLIVQNPHLFSVYGRELLSFLSSPLLSTHVEALVANTQCTKTELAEIQLNQLKKLVRFSYRQVPFWRDWISKSRLQVPENFETLKDFELIPVTSKNTLRLVPLKERSAENLLRYSKLDSTSGSTGEPFKFLLDIRGAERKTALALRGLKWSNGISSNRIIRVRNRDLSLIVGGMHIKFREAADLDSIIAILERESRRDRFVLHSHASNHSMIAEQTKRRRANITPGVILTTSEHCT